MKLTTKIKEITKELKEVQKMSFRDIAKKLENDYDFKVSFQALQQWYTTEYAEKMNETSTVSKELYKVENWYYIFYKKFFNEETDDYETETIPVPVETIDNIFQSFSRHWKDWSSEKIIQEFKLKPETFYMIKSRLRLYKYSHIVSPFTLKQMEVEWKSKEDIEKFLEEKIDDNFQDKFANTFKDSYEKTRTKIFEKWMAKVSSKENYIDMFQQFISTYEPQKYLENRMQLFNNKERFNFEKYERLAKENGFETAERYREETKDNNWPWTLKERCYVIADLHLWKENSVNVITRIQQLQDDIIKSDTDVVHLFCLGDLVETIIPWWIHTGQTDKMTEIGTGFDLIMKVVNIFEWFIYNLGDNWKTVNFYWIGGNHDRIWKWNFEDKERTGAQIIYEMLKRSFKEHKGIMIYNYIERVWKVVINGINYIFEHGDFLKGSKMNNLGNYLWNNGDTNYYNIVLHWHYHNICINETRWWTSISCPWLAGSGEYDKALNLFSEPWYILIENNKYWTPDIKLCRLQNDNGWIIK